MFCLPSNICIRFLLYSPLDSPQINSLETIPTMCRAAKINQRRDGVRNVLHIFQRSNDFSMRTIQFFLGSTNATMLRTTACSIKPRRPNLVKFHFRTHTDLKFWKPKSVTDPFRDFFLRNSDRLKEANETESRKCFNTIVKENRGNFIAHFSFYLLFALH